MAEYADLPHFSPSFAEKPHGKNMSSTLDNFDKKILHILQLNCRVASEEIAGQVGLSASAVQRRIKRLREEGIIAAEVAIIDGNVSSHGVSFLAEIEIERDNYAVIGQFKQWASDQHWIQQVFYVTGHFDLMLVINAPSPTDYDRYIEDLMARYPQIKRVTTNVVLDTPKKGLYLPI